MKEKDKPPLCKCGCGVPMAKKSYWPHTWNKYIVGHNWIGKKHLIGTRAKMHKAHTGKKQGPPSAETRAKISKAHIGKKHSIETRAKMRISMSIAHIKKWKNYTSNQRDIHIKNIRAANNISPNIPERSLRDYLKCLLPKEYKFVGDGTVVMGGRCPDFINVNGQKKIIELFGDYWHGKEKTGRTRKQEQNQRIKHFAKYGFKTLIVWESELKNIEKLKKRIIRFQLSSEVAVRNDGYL